MMTASPPASGAPRRRIAISRVVRVPAGALTSSARRWPRRRRSWGTSSTCDLGVEAMRRLILIVAALALAACSSAQQSIERAGEKTGQTLDRAAKATGQAVDRAGRATGNALARAGEAIERKVGN